jgi:hypothetical protein
MALNMQNKKSLADQVLPEVEFSINSSGVIIQAGDRFSTARFLPFDKCKCHPTECDLDFVVEQHGVTVFSNRFKSRRFVPFDNERDLPGFCFFKIRNKGRCIKIKHDFSSSGKQNVQEAPQPTQLSTTTSSQSVTSPPNHFQPDKGSEEELNRFFDSLAAATHGIPTNALQAPKVEQKKTGVKRSARSLKEKELPIDPFVGQTFERNTQSIVGDTTTPPRAHDGILLH